MSYVPETLFHVGLRRTSRVVSEVMGRYRWGRTDEEWEAAEKRAYQFADDHSKPCPGCGQQRFIGFRPHLSCRDDIAVVETTGQQPHFQCSCHEHIDREVEKALAIEPDWLVAPDALS